jgi:hypothetical protein
VSDQGEPTAGAATRLRWWREVIYILLVYVAYSGVRNTFGSSDGGALDARPAFGHAKQMIRIERALHLYFEQHVQSWYLDLPSHGFIRVWNIFYGLAHFLVTFAALVWLFRRDKSRYPLWRNTLAFTTLLALIGFASFSLMPPRLLDDPGPFGGCQIYAPAAAAHDPHACNRYGYVDTVVEYGGWASFDSGTMKTVSNQYAAMPSMHIGWSLWCAMVIVPLTRRRWSKALAMAHPVITLFVVVVTANHYWIDGVGGIACLAGGFAISRALTPRLARIKRVPAASAH